MNNPNEQVASLVVAEGSPEQFAQEARQSTVVTAYYDSLEWMRTALRQDQESGRSSQTNPNLTALKIGQVCCGYAIELAYKSLLYSQGKPHSQKMETHDVSHLHSLVDQPDCEQIEAACEELLASHESSFAPRNGKEYIKYIADEYTHPDVKYWGKRATTRRSKKVTKAGLLPSSDGFSSIVVVQKLHCAILDLARRRTWPDTWHQYQADVSQTGFGQYDHMQRGPLMATFHLTDAKGNWVGKWELPKDSHLKALNEGNDQVITE